VHERRDVGPAGEFEEPVVAAVEVRVADERIPGADDDEPRRVLAGGRSAPDLRRMSAD
jgi:hypothetical protein